MPRRFWQRLQPAGFTVELRSVRDLEYRERGRLMKPRVAELPTATWRPTVAVHRADLRHWEPPHEQEPVSEGQQAHIMRNLEGELWRQYRIRVDWGTDPQSLGPPSRGSGVLFWARREDTIALTASFESTEQLRRLWALLGAALWREWGLDLLVAQQEGEADLIATEAIGRALADADERMESALGLQIVSPEDKSLVYALLTNANHEQVHQALLAWAPIARTLVGCRVGGPLSPRAASVINSFVCAGELPNGRVGFLVPREPTTMRVVVPRPQAEETLDKLARWVQPLDLRLEAAVEPLHKSLPLWPFKRNAEPPDDGFEVELAGPFRAETLYYGENDRWLSLGGEYPSFLKDDLDHWDPPHEGERLSDADKDRVMANIERALGEEIDWQDSPRPLEPPPPEEGTLWWSASDEGLELMASFEDRVHLSHLWALLGCEFSRHWQIDTLVARWPRGSRAAWLDDVPGEIWDKDVMNHSDAADSWPPDPNSWPFQAWAERRDRRSPYYQTVVHPAFSGIYQLIAHWASEADLIMGFRAGEPATSDWLPRIDDAARALHLPRGEHGYILHQDARVFRVFSPPAKREQTLKKLSELALSRSLRLERRP